MRMRHRVTRCWSQPPTSTAIPATTMSATHAPMKTDTGDPVRAAMPAVKSCERSPHCAVNNTTKLVTAIRHDDVSPTGALASTSSARPPPRPRSRPQARDEQQHRPRGEEQEGDAQDDSLRKQAEQATGGHRDGALHRQCESHTDPHGHAAVSGRKDEGGDKRLVRQFGREDQDEGERYDTEIEPPHEGSLAIAHH